MKFTARLVAAARTRARRRRRLDWTDTRFYEVLASDLLRIQRCGNTMPQREAVRYRSLERRDKARHLMPIDVR